MKRRGQILSCVLVGASVALTALPAGADQVRWITPPPVAIQNGGQFTVQWEVRGFAEGLTANAVAWGITSVLGQTSNQLGGNCVYTATVNVPATTTSGTLYYAAFAQTATKLAYTEPAPVFLTVGPAAATYFPFEPGSGWQYAETGGITSTRLVRPGTEAINCVPTRVLDYLDTGNRQYVTVDPDGFRFHRIEDPVTGRVDTYSPPWRVTYADLIVGQTVHTSGVVEVLRPGQPPETLPYSIDVTVQAFEFITVPAGDFNTVRLLLELSIDGVPTEWTNWFAPGIGLVKQTQGEFTRELVATTLP